MSLLNVGTVQAQAELGIRGFKNSLRKMRRDGEKTTSDVEGSFKGMGRQLAMIGAQAAAALGASFIAISGVAIKQAAEFESLRTSMDALNGSAEEGARNFERLKEFSAGTPFQLKGLAEAQNMLQGFGMSADDAFESLTMIGDIAAITGADINGIGIAFGQAAAEGRLMTRDIRQLINQGVPAIKLLADTMGVAQSEVLDLASNGKISFEILQESFRDATSEGGMFADGMKRQSQTLNGVFSTLKDNVSILLGEFGKTISEAADLRDGISGLTGFVQGLTEAVKNSADEIQKTADVMRGFGIIIGQSKDFVDKFTFSTGKLNTVLRTIQTGGLNYIASFVTDRVADIGKASRFLNDFGDALSKISDNDADETIENIDNKMNGIVGATKKASTSVANLNRKFSEQIQFLQTLDGIKYFVSSQKAAEGLAQAVNSLKLPKPEGTIFDPTFVGASIEPMQRLNDIVREMGNQDYTQRLSEDFGKVSEKTQEATEFGRLFSTTLADGLEGIIFRARSVEDAIKGIIRQLASRALTTGIFSLFGGIGGGGFLASMFGGTFHTGGIVPGVGEKNVSVQGGEMILTKSQQKALASGGGGMKELKLTINVRGSSEITGDTIRTAFNENTRQLARLQ